MYVFTQISTYREYTHTLTDLYTRICTYPDSACSRHINRFGGGKKKKKSQSQLFSRFYNLRSSKSQMRGFNMSNQNVSYYNVLNDCIQAFPRCSVAAPQKKNNKKTNRATLLMMAVDFTFSVCLSRSWHYYKAAV